MKKIDIQNMDGNSEQITLVSSFVIEDINKKFAILSRGEAVGEGTAKLYISEVFETGGENKFIGIVDEVVWDKVKQTMKSLVQGNPVKKYSYQSVTPAILEGFRIIGLKNSDLESIAKNSEDDSDSNVEQSIDKVIPEEAPIATETADSIVAPTPSEPVEMSAEVPSGIQAEPIVTPEEVKTVESDMVSNNASVIDSSAVSFDDTIAERNETADDNSLIGTPGGVNDEYDEDNGKETDIQENDSMSDLDKKYDKFLDDTEKILEETRNNINDMLDNYDKRVLELASDYIESLEKENERLQIENEAYRKAIGKVIKNINIDE